MDRFAAKRLPPVHISQMWGNLPPVQNGRLGVVGREKSILTMAFGRIDALQVTFAADFATRGSVTSEQDQDKERPQPATSVRYGREVFVSMLNERGLC